MSAVVACKSCGSRFKAPAHLAGKRVRCKCGSPIAIPVPPPPVADELDLSAMSEGVSVETAPCPSCGAAMTEGAVVCMACGFNKATGTAVGGAETDADEKPRKKKAVVAAEDDGFPSVGARLAKVAIWLVVLGALGGAGWYIRGAIMHNPAAEAKELLPKFANGMNPEEVVAIVGKPPRETWTQEDPPEGSQSMIPKDIRLPYQKPYFATYGKERLKYGFVFLWRFSERSILRIHFDEEGKVVESEIFDPMKALGF